MWCAIDNHNKNYIPVQKDFLDSDFNTRLTKGGLLQPPYGFPRSL